MELSVVKELSFHPSYQHDTDLEILAILLPYLENKIYQDIGAKQGKLREFFNSHGLTTPVNDSKGLCASTHNLLLKDAIKPPIGLIKADIESHGLDILKKAVELQPEILIFGYVASGNASVEDQGHPSDLIEEAKKLGFCNFIVIKQFKGFETILLNNCTFVDQQSGNIIFIKDNIFNNVKEEIKKFISKKETDFYMRISKDATDSKQSESEYAKQLDKQLGLMNDRLNVLEKRVSTLRTLGLVLIKRAVKRFLKPRLGIANPSPPKPIIIPKKYTMVRNLQHTPKISIATPSYNHGKFIEKTIVSVINQNYPATEYIIQDGGSNDNTIEIIRAYESKVKHWESAKDKGQSNAINLGLLHATGEIMAYLNSDDLLLPGTLHYVADFFNKNSDVDVVYGHRVLIDEFDQEVGRWVLPPHNDEILNWADFIPQETLFWRRKIWEKIGSCIDESFQFAMDWDLLLRFKEAGANFVRLPRFLGAFRVHSSQKTSAISEVGEQEMQRLRHRYLGRNVSPQEIHKKVKSYLIQHALYDRLYRAGVLRY